MSRSKQAAHSHASCCLAWLQHAHLLLCACATDLAMASDLEIVGNDCHLSTHLPERADKHLWVSMHSNPDAVHKNFGGLHGHLHPVRQQPAQQTQIIAPGISGVQTQVIQSCKVESLWHTLTFLPSHFVLSSFVLVAFVSSPVRQVT